MVSNFFCKIKVETSARKKMEKMLPPLTQGDPQKWIELQCQLNSRYRKRRSSPEGRGSAPRPPCQTILRGEDFLYKSLLRKWGLRCDQYAW